MFDKFLERIELPPKNFLREFSMDKGMAAPADIDATLLHVRPVKVLSEPFVAMAASGDQVMKSN